MTDNKTDKFLEAIEKYANLQKQQIQEEIESYKAEEIKKSEQQAIKEAYALVKKESNERHAAVIRELAMKETESRKALFEKREKITSEVFNKARKKLSEYSKTPDYLNLLRSAAEKISKLFAGDECTVYVKEEDLAYKDEISKCFSGSCRVVSASDIKLGGLRAVCENSGISVDETLDSHLENQHESFVLLADMRIY